MNVTRWLSVWVLASVLVGCSSMKKGDVTQAKLASDKPRAGSVYLLRGWIGIFSTGIDRLGEELAAADVKANVYQETQWRKLAKQLRDARQSGSDEPLVLIGHSYGADGVIAMSRLLADANVPVDLVITLDPVTPADVPGNVRRCVNLYQSNGVMDKLPWLRGIPLKKDAAATQTELVNADIRRDRTDLLEPGLDHFNIEKKPKVHAEVIKQVLAVCPVRTSFVAARVPSTQPALSETVMLKLTSAGSEPVAAHTSSR